METKISKRRPKETSSQQNEGEGNKTAAWQYNEAQRQFLHSGKVDQRANAAEKALDSAERSELAQVGKSHARAEDPAVKKH